MSYAWPKDADFTPWELDVLDRDRPVCGRMTHICDRHCRHFHTLTGPVELVCKLSHCPDSTCPVHASTKSPELERTIAQPDWAIGWNVFCWIGHRRYSRHWAISEIPSELLDKLRHQALRGLPHPVYPPLPDMLAARQEDPEALRRQYEAVDEIILSIDGLQPEKVRANTIESAVSRARTDLKRSPSPLLTKGGGIQNLPVIRGLRLIQRFCARNPGAPPHRL